MLRILLCLFLLAFCTTAWSQDDPYNAYLNEGKRTKSTRTGSGRPVGNFADRYMQDAGASFNSFTDQGFRSVLPGFQYIGRYNVYEKNDVLGMAISAHPSIGLQMDNFFGSFFMLNVPVMLEGTVGRGSTRYNQQWVGLSLGVGPEFNLVNGFNQFGLSSAATFRFNLGGRYYFIRYSTSIVRPTEGVYITALSFGNSFF